MDGKLINYLTQDKKRLVKVIAGVILFAAALTFYFLEDRNADGEVVISSIPDPTAEAGSQIPGDAGSQISGTAVEAEPKIMVDVAGAVSNPSVVELPEGSRVFEAVESAGGLTKEADTRFINLAAVLTDGEKLYIPTRQEVSDSQNGTAGSGGSERSNSYAYYPGSDQSKLININTADSEALQKLPGIGPATAEKIISYRSENGKFKSVEEIKNVNGIGEKTFEKFKNKITI